MNSVQRTGVYAFYLSLSLFTSCFALSAKENKDGSGLNNANTTANSSNNNHAMAVVPTEFQWADHNKLSWTDFQGPVNAVTEESAAATHCGIGFRTGRATPDSKPGIIVYNTFYVNKSWVRADAMIPEILVHEQGHFDLCEIYTRKLRQRMQGVDMNAANLRAVLESIYFAVKNEYESRQQAYEDETTHGTNFAQQNRWRENISRELADNADYAGSLAMSSVNKAVRSGK